MRKNARPYNIEEHVLAEKKAHVIIDAWHVGEEGTTFNLGVHPPTVRKGQAFFRIMASGTNYWWNVCTIFLRPNSKIWRGPEFLKYNPELQCIFLWARKKENKNDPVLCMIWRGNKQTLLCLSYLRPSQQQHLGGILKCIIKKSILYFLNMRFSVTHFFNKERK